MPLDYFLQSLDTLERRAQAEDQKALSLAKMAVAKEATALATLNQTKATQTARFDKLSDLAMQMGLNMDDSPTKSILSSNLRNEAIDLKSGIQKINADIKNTRSRISNVVSMSDALSNEYIDIAGSSRNGTLIEKASIDNDREIADALTILDSSYKSSSEADKRAAISLATAKNRKDVYNMLKGDAEYELMRRKTEQEIATSKSVKDANDKRYLLDEINKTFNIAGKGKQNALAEVYGSWSGYGDEYNVVDTGIFGDNFESQASNKNVSPQDVSVLERAGFGALAEKYLQIVKPIIEDPSTNNIAYAEGAQQQAGMVIHQVGQKLLEMGTDGDLKGRKLAMLTKSISKMFNVDPQKLIKAESNYSGYSKIMESKEALEDARISLTTFGNIKPAQNTPMMDFMDNLKKISKAPKEEAEGTGTEDNSAEIKSRRNMSLEEYTNSPEYIKKKHEGIRRSNEMIKYLEEKYNTKKLSKLDLDLIEREKAGDDYAKDHYTYPRDWQEIIMDAITPTTEFDRYLYEIRQTEYEDLLEKESRKRIKKKNQR